MVSVYAQGKDYHDLVKRRLKRLGRWLLDQAAGGEIKVFVDTAPVMEKPLAQAAGLGWQGKHTNLLARDLGNWFFLGAIFTTLDLPKDAPEVSHCGTCTRLSGHLPDRGLSGALSTGCAALHFLSDHRAQGPGGGQPAPPSGQPHLWLR
jgi:epoxyqueuosine reductase QueG